MITNTANMIANNDDSPMIYVACLASYNAGILHGAWIYVDSDPDVMGEEIQTMLAGSPTPDAEEFAIHDTDCCDGLEIGEYSSLSEIAERFEFIEDCHDEDLAIACLKLGSDLDDAKDYLNRFAGSADSFLDYASEYADECLLGDVPNNVRFYFDYQAFARDLACEMTTETVNGTVYIFHS
jgi:antirestriction protein